MSGSFAGGLADGLRNGMQMAQLYEQSTDRRMARDKAVREDADKEAIKKEMMGQGGVQSGVSRLGLTPITVAPAFDSASQGDLTSSLGLDMAVAHDNQQAAVRRSMPTATAGGAGATFGSESGLQPVPVQKKSLTPGDSFQGRNDDYAEMADTLTRGYRKALELGAPDQALDLLVRREKVIGQHRETAFGAAMNRYQMSSDPNAFVPFLNRFSETGIQVEGIRAREETGGGKPIYEITGYDPSSKAKFTTPFTQAQMDDYIRRIGDPATARSMMVQQAKAHMDLATDLKKQQQKAELERQAEAAKPRVLGKDDILYAPGADGQTRAIAYGAEAGDSKPAASNKDFTSYVFKLNGVESMTDIGDDQREKIGRQIAIGENIGALNRGMPGSRALTPANLATLSAAVRDGKAELRGVRMSDGRHAIVTRYEGHDVIVPQSVVPPADLERVKQQLDPNFRARGSGAQQAPAASPAAPTPAPPPRGTPAIAPSSESPSVSPAGTRLDAARAQVRTLEQEVHRLRSNPPGLKRPAEERDAHRTRLQEAEDKLAMAKAGAKGAEDEWTNSVGGSDMSRAAFNRSAQ